MVVKRTATERALVALLGGPLGCSAVGAIVWEGAGVPRRGRVSAVNGGGDYAAQMLLGRMRKAGLVRTTHDLGSSQWELTVEGLKRARTIIR